MIMSMAFTTFKGTVSRDFRLLFFFHQTIPPRALIHGLKPFRIWLRMSRENRVGNRQNRLPRSDKRPRKTIFFVRVPL
jgi:hypothetical protein